MIERAGRHRAEAAAVAQLRELDQRKDDFVSTVSHELRTPLTSIAGYTELLADGAGGELSDTQRRIVEVVAPTPRACGC